MKFSDESDRASYLEEQEREHAMAQAKAAPRLVDTGLCHYCESPVDDGMHFCDNYCRDYWQRHREAERLRGKP